MWLSLRATIVLDVSKSMAWSGQQMRAISQDPSAVARLTTAAAHVQPGQPFGELAARRLDDRGNRVGTPELRVAGVQIGDPAGEPIFSGPALSQEASDVMPCVIRHHLSFCRSGAPPCPTRMTIQTTRLMNGIEGALIGR